MTFDSETTKGPDVSKVPHVGGARPAAVPTPPAPAAPLRAEPRQPAAALSTPAAAPQIGAAAKPSERQFEQSLAGLSRSLGERAALHPDLVAEAAARRAAVLTQIRAEDRRLKLVVGVAGAAVAAVCLAAAIVFFTAPFGPRAAAPVATARAQPAAAAPAVDPPPPVQTADVEPAPAPPVPAPAPPVPAPAPPVAAPAPVPVADPPPVSTASAEPSPAPLARDDVREIQTRLLAFGFNAGPADGNAGRATEGAIMNYQQKRGLPQTGTPDRALLDQLRDDPAPKVVAQQPQPPGRTQPQNAYQNAPPSRAANPGTQRRGDGLDFMRDADARISRWFQSLSN
jgi:hypothetical protein